MSADSDHRPTTRLSVDVPYPLDLALLEADVVRTRERVLRLGRRVVTFEGARHSWMSLKHALADYDLAVRKAYVARGGKADP